jgi:hypothetical protein
MGLSAELLVSPYKMLTLYRDFVILQEKIGKYHYYLIRLFYQSISNIAIVSVLMFFLCTKDNRDKEKISKERNLKNNGYIH